MRISFHIGPHKTGTTSVQAYLQQHFGSERPVGPIWYPKYNRMMPGHAHLAQLMNSEPFNAQQNPLKAVIRDAKNAGVEHLILSSENFSMVPPHGFNRYGDALATENVHLISTQNSAVNRAVSIWQEVVKHGWPHAIENSLESIFAQSGYRPDLLSSFAKALRPGSITIIYSSPGDPPSLLLDRMSEALGVQKILGPAPEICHNVRMGKIEVELLRLLNNLLNQHAAQFGMEKYYALREVMRNGFDEPVWKQHCPNVPIEAPEELIQAARVRAREIADDIASLESDWPVHSLGPPEALTQEF